MLLFLPIIQQHYQFVNSKPLKGAIDSLARVQFYPVNWISGQFQDYLEDYTKENIGFRSVWIRLNNQRIFSLHNFAKANGVLIGKNNYLYEKHYIESYLGYNYVGVEAINEKVGKLKKIIDTLGSLNVKLFPIIAPGKGSFFPEFFPNNYSLDEKRISN